MREERKDRAKDFLDQSKEFLSVAIENRDKGRLNAATFNAIQAIINANDALTTRFLEKRASKNHREAIQLHIDVVRIIHDDSGRGILKEALDKRSAVGYIGEKIKLKEAKSIVDKAIKFVGWVKRLL